LVIRDKDHETGKRVFGLSDKGSTEQIRELWENKANAHLERAGSDARIDRRSLEAQGIDRVPTIHIGPAVLAMSEKGERPASQEREYRQPDRPGVARNDNMRSVDYPNVDQGRTRIERHAEITDLNRERQLRADAERSRGADERSAAAGESAAALAARSEQAAKVAREVELYKQALAQQSERERAQQAAQHERQQEALTRQQWTRAANEQRQDARRDEEAARLAASIERHRKEQEGSSGLIGWMMDKINPAKAEERQRAEQERRDQQERDRQAERSTRQREREQRNFAEQQELARKQEHERELLRQRQAEREQAQLAELKRQQELRVIEKARYEKSRQSRQMNGPDKSRERERERPGRDDFGL
jgi:MobA/MobL family